MRRRNESVLELRISRLALLRATSVALGLALALGLCEGAARVLAVAPAAPRQRLDTPDDGHEVQCYPRMPGARLPLDLEREADRHAFEKLLPELEIRKVVERLAGNQVMWRVVERFDGAEAVRRLRATDPLCVIYDNRPGGPREQAGVSMASGTIGVLGDSFAYGMGNSEQDSFIAKLAAASGRRVRSYASPAANLPEILEEFERALAERKHFGISTILYLYNLNDPFETPELSKLIAGAVAATSISQGAEEPSGVVLKLLGAARSFSALSRWLVFRWYQQEATALVTSYYRAMNDPALNTRLGESFERIATMSAAARRAGLRFVLMPYPLVSALAPYPFAAAHENLRRLAADKGIEFHDLLPAFQRPPARAEMRVHPLDDHPDPEAQERAAREAAAYLGLRR